MRRSVRPADGNIQALRSGGRSPAPGRPVRPRSESTAVVAGDGPGGGRRVGPFFAFSAGKVRGAAPKMVGIWWFSAFFRKGVECVTRLPYVDYHRAKTPVREVDHRRVGRMLSANLRKERSTHDQPGSHRVASRREGRSPSGRGTDRSGQRDGSVHLAGHRFRNRSRSWIDRSHHCGAARRPLETGGVSPGILPRRLAQENTLK